MPQQPAFEVVDCHTHFADPDHPKGIVRSVLPAVYRELVAPLGVTGTIVTEKCGPLLGDRVIYPPGLLGSPGTGRGRASAAPLSRERWATSVPSGARSASRWQASARARERSCGYAAPLRLL